MRCALPMTIALALAGAPLTAAHGLTPESRARVEMAGYGVLYGAGAGLLLTEDLELSDGAAQFGGGLLTGTLAAAGGTGGWLAARAGDLHPGQVRLSGAAGFWTLIYSAIAAKTLVRRSTPVPKWAIFAASGLASGVTAAATLGRDVSEGDVALINSGGLWTPLVGGLLAASVATVVRGPKPPPPPDDAPGARRDGNGSIFAWSWMGLSAAGLGVGAVLADAYDPSHGQVLALDLGLLTGLVVGGGISFVLNEEGDHPAWVFLGALSGMAAGGALAVHIMGFDGAADAPVDGGRAGLARASAPPPAVPLWFGVW